MATQSKHFYEQGIAIQLLLDLSFPFKSINE